jgi:hypothetical protein
MSVSTTDWYFWLDLCRPKNRLPWSVRGNFGVHTATWGAPENMTQVAAQIPSTGHQSLVKLIWDANNSSAGFSVGASTTSCAFAFGRNFRGSHQSKLE